MNSTITKKITNFIKYHNAFTIILLLVFLFSGVIFASSGARKAVIGEKVITKSGIDNTELLDTDLDNFDFEITITSISEDDKKYYIEYSFNTLGIQNNVWQAITNYPTLSVYKDALGENDLGLYITEKFSQVADYQLSYLKEAKEAQEAEQQIVETTQYTGLYYSLIGKVLDIKEKAFPGYESVSQSTSETSQGGSASESDNCTPDWQCDNWQPSVDFKTLNQKFTQTRNCSDLNSCDTNDSKRIEQQTAVGVLFEPVVTTNSINCNLFSVDVVDSSLIDGTNYILSDGTVFVSSIFDGITAYFYRDYCE